MKKTLTLTLAFLLIFSMSFQVLAYQQYGGESKIGNSAVKYEISVKSEEKFNEMAQLMMKINEKHQNQIAKMSQIRFMETSKGEAMVEGRKEAKLFGLLNVQKTFQYRIEDDGSLTRNKRWFEYLFSEENEEEVN